jgi:uncharacterized membrane protein
LARFARQEDEMAATLRGPSTAEIARALRNVQRRSPIVDDQVEIEHHPVVIAHTKSRAADTQLRIADAITSFAGSMRFVYIHAVAFALWMAFVESDPWPKLTLVVSLEAIFLSTFVMIGQNRQSEFQQAKADHDFVAQEKELQSNTELTRAIHTLTTDIHRQVMTNGGGSSK